MPAGKFLHKVPVMRVPGQIDAGQVQRIPSGRILKDITDQVIQPRALHREEDHRAIPLSGDIAVDPILTIGRDGRVVVRLSNL